MELSPYRQQMSTLPRLPNGVEEGLPSYHSHRPFHQSDYKKYMIKTGRITVKVGHEFIGYICKEI
jgi:hypothetical protein